ncbi:DUF6152 family protein [Pseudomonas lopnurensis]|jgi:hypothetical protein|uniref:DUF6152 family protein n=1 Tax=Pseudomonas lopnurensis TaxID=1477517 RepID=UPI001879E430|nr:DUF6152 family protein [Pseudomonas lopnurensis]MBE7375063.1 hypothetical protein [Pseudomonas lopnurensis]
MSFRAPISRILAAGVALSASAAFAHHGWFWAESEQMELTGTVTRVQIAPPHPWLDVEAPDGTWRVELGNPSQTQRAGFTAESASEGDTITAIGNRSKDESEKRMKAVQIEVGGETYDIYPERIQSP